MTNLESHLEESTSETSTSPLSSRLPKVNRSKSSCANCIEHDSSAMIPPANYKDCAWLIANE